MAHWLEVPDLEVTLRDMNVEPASLDLLRAAVSAITEKLNRPVKIVRTDYTKSTIVTFEGIGLRFYNVGVSEEEYSVLFQHEAAQVNMTFGYTADLAWRICGYPCSPADMREARDVASREGITDLKNLPPRFFRPRRRTRQGE